MLVALYEPWNLPLPLSPLEEEEAGGEEEGGGRRRSASLPPRWLQQLSWEEQCNSFKQFQDISGLAMQQTKKERMLHRSWTWVLWCPSNLNRSRFASITLEVQCHGMIALAGAIGIHSGIVSTLHSTFSCLQNWTISAYAVYPKSWESSNEFQQFSAPPSCRLGGPPALFTVCEVQITRVPHNPDGHKQSSIK